MKKIIAIVVTAIALTGCVDANVLASQGKGYYTVNLEKLQKEAICQSNAASFYPECNAASTNKSIQCKVDLTDEITGKIQRGLDFTIGANDKFTASGNTRTYHEEDATGSTTVQLDMKTGKGFISLMNETQVTNTGNISCKL